MFRYNSSIKNVCVLANPRTREGEAITSQGLAYTPCEMDAMRRQGIPISTQNLESQYFDGSDDPSFDVPIEQQRGVDPADVYNAQINARRVLKEINAKISLKKRKK